MSATPVTLAEPVVCAWCADDFYALDDEGVCVGCRNEAAREEAERWAQNR